ncbi:hypothetical protein RI367_005589 [Sorochytrium milnesiophthora]
MRVLAVLIAVACVLGLASAAPVTQTRHHRRPHHTQTTHHARRHRATPTTTQHNHYAHPRHTTTAHRRHRTRPVHHVTATYPAAPTYPVAEPTTVTEPVPVPAPTSAVPTYTYAPAPAPTSAPPAPPSNDEPPCPHARPGNTYFGTSLKWDSDSPAQYAARLDRTPAVFNYFARISSGGIEHTEWVDGAVSGVKEVGATLLLTLEPWDGLEAVTDQAIAATVTYINSINQRGVPVLLRFAHEMNGGWYPWAQKPVQYRETFQRLARAIKQGTTNTFMVWVPNEGQGYPFKAPIAVSSAEDRAMDTNGDGTVDGRDDPYTPYFPGAEYVDWVGLDLYHLGDMANNANSAPALGEFRNGISDFYDAFAHAHNKPFGLFETASTYYPQAANANQLSQLDVKRPWWSQIFDADIPRSYPLFNLVCWFEEAKVEAGAMRDFRLTADQSVLAALKTDLPSWVRFAESK